MRLKRFYICLSIITVISLLYVQLQVEIVKLAYEGKAKEDRFKDLLDNKSHLMYNINTLESANNLGHSLLCVQKDLQFTDKNQITALKLTQGSVKTAKIITPSSERRKSNLFVRLFSLNSQAEAIEKLDK